MAGDLFATPQSYLNFSEHLLCQVLCGTLVNSSGHEAGQVSALEGLPV